VPRKNEQMQALDNAVAEIKEAYKKKLKPVAVVVLAAYEGTDGTTITLNGHGQVALNLLLQAQMELLKNMVVGALPTGGKAQ
jgi:hypothetical protein